MLDCSQPGGQDYTLQEIILRLLSELKIPIAYGFSSGHVRCANRVLPFGVRGRLTVKDNVRLECDAAVTHGEGIPRAMQGQSGR
jgi:muramoyltetrapeptide carboxypeptidase LdcA involved in peptidoglycan recycling